MSKLQDLYEQSNGVQSSERASTGSRLDQLFYESNPSGVKAPPPVPEVPTPVTPPAKPGLLKTAYNFGKSILSAPFTKSGRENVKEGFIEATPAAIGSVQESLGRVIPAIDRGVEKLTGRGLIKDAETVGAGYREHARENFDLTNTLQQESPIKVDPNASIKDLLNNKDYVQRNLLGGNMPNLAIGAIAGAATSPLGGIGALAGTAGATGLIEGGYAIESTRQDLLATGDPYYIELANDDKFLNSIGKSVGIINGVLEATPIGIAFSKTPGGKTLKGKIIRNITKLVATSLSEGLTESAQEVVSNAVKKTYDENQELFNKEVALSGIVGGVLGAGLGVVGQTTTAGLGIGRGEKEAVTPKPPVQPVLQPKPPATSVTPPVTPKPEVVVPPVTPKPEVVAPSTKPTLTIKPAPKPATPGFAEIQKKPAIVPEQLVTKTQAKQLLKSLGEESVNFTVVDDGGTLYMTYKKGTADIKLRPSALGLTEVNIKPGQTININTTDLKKTGPTLRGVTAKGDTYASSGAAKIDSFESRIGEPASGTKNIKLHEEISKLVKKYASRVGEGYLPRGAVGVYHTDTTNIRLKGMNEVSVASHEITHSLDFANKISNDLMKVVGYSKSGNPIYDSETNKIRKELTGMYVRNYPGGKGNHKLKKRMVEGYATLLQKYVEAPTTTTQNYPNLVKEMLLPGGKYYRPVVGEIISDLNRIVETYQGLSALDKVGAVVTSDSNITGKDSFLNFEERVLTEVADEIYPIEKLGKLAGTEWSPQDPSLWTRLYKSQGAIYGANVIGNKGYWALNPAGDGFHKVHDFNWKTLNKKLQKEQTYDIFNNYLVARDQYFNFQELDRLKKEWETSKSPEVYKEYREQKKIMDGNGFSKEVVKEAYFESKDKFVEEEKMFDALVREDLKLLNHKDIQLLSDDEFKKLTSKEGYASLKRQFYDEIVGDVNDKGSGSFGKKPSSLKRRKGSSRTIIAPVLSGLVNHAEIQRKALKQIVYNKFVKIAKSNIAPDLFQVQQLRAIPDKNTGGFIFPQENDKNIIIGRVDGKRVPVLVDGYIKKTLDEIIDFKSIDIFGKFMQASSRIFTKSTTALYLPFAAVNFTIDQITAVAQTTQQYKPIYDPLKEVYKLLSDRGGKEAEYFQEYQVIGGERQTFAHHQDESAKEIAARIASEREGILKVYDILDKGGNILSIPSKYSEIITRGVEYTKARQAGDSQLVALERAGRVTAPFHHVGRLGGSTILKGWLRSVPYLNAGLQVLAQTYRALTKGGVKARNRVLFVLLALVAANLASLATLLSMGSKEQKDQYKDLNPTELASAIWLPKTSGKGLIKIRIPNQMNILGPIVNMAIMDMIGETKYQAGDYIAAGTSFLPQQIDVFNIPEMMFSWIPQMIKPELSVAINKKDYPEIRDIESQSQQAKEPGRRSTPYTTKIAKWFGEKTNISPIKIDFLITGVFGRSTGFVTGKEGVWNPLTSMSRAYYFEGGRRLQDYYDLKQENDLKYNTFLHDPKSLTAEERKNINEERSKLKAIGNLMDAYGEVDIEKNPEKATNLREKILINIEELQ